jgi:hypothetical protein
LFLDVAYDIEAPLESAWVRIASSVLGFDHGPLEETQHAGSDAYPGAFHWFSASSIEGT